MKKLKVRIITGFREDQSHTIDAEEAHKAYYLFLHPEERGIFKDGLALVGKDIRAIEPDYHATMGWNPSHNLDGDDYNQIRGCGVDRELRDMLSLAKEVATMVPLREMNLPLSELVGRMSNLNLLEGKGLTKIV